jgi:acetoin utilization deacetylase AcuC-like enzyme
VLSLRLLAPEVSPNARVVRPGRATQAQLTTYHDSEYIDFVLDAANSNSTGAPVSAAHVRFGLEDVRSGTLD